MLHRARLAVAARLLGAVLALGAPAIGVAAIGATVIGVAGTGVAGARAPLPAGRFPSPISKMVCAAKAQREMAQVLGEEASVTRPRWVAHLYSCRYRYGHGSFGLSVKELSGARQTTAYFDALGTEMGDTRSVANLGQGAFQTRDGSMVVRKDWKVLLVDISGLPGQFGRPPTSAGAVAVTVADLILGCWAGD